MAPSSSVPQDKRTIVDWILAACICLAAVFYWAWDHKPANLPQPQAQPAAVTESQRALGDRLNNEGSRLYSASDFTGAEEQFRNAIAANPAGALGYCNLGAALIAEHRYDEAMAELRKAIALNPSLTLARNNLNWAVQEKAKARQ